MSGFKEPLRSQVQLKMTSEAKYVDVRSWVLHYESLSTPWGFTVQGKAAGSGNADTTPQPMDVDIISGKKGKDGKGKKGKEGKGKKGKDGKGKGKDVKGRVGDGKGQWGNKWNGGWNSSGQWGAQPRHNSGWNSGGSKSYKGQGKGKGGGKQKGDDVCNLCGQRGRWKRECPQKGKGKVNQIDAGNVVPSSAPASSTLTSASTTLPSAS